MKPQRVVSAATATRIARGAGLAVLVLVTAGCPPVRDPTPAAADTDGVPCADEAVAAAPRPGPVYIEVTYADDGMPRVEPVRCAILDGTRVTWRGPRDEPVAFEVRFKQATPQMREQGALVSTSRDYRHRVERTLSRPGEYRYSVFANGKELDPAIIIR